MTDRIALFAGTTEGRELAEYLEGFSAQVWIFTATEYGKIALGEHRKAEVRSGRMKKEEIEQFLLRQRIQLVVDATHPFAKQVTENLKEVCESCRIFYLRCLRKWRSPEGGAQSGEISEEMGTGASRISSSRASETVIRVDSVPEAVEYLKGTQGNILITTGTKELETYTELSNFQERCYARVLSAVPSVSRACALGFAGRHLIAMQGPFSKEMNVALLHETGARYLVTKDSGEAGGFPEKREAAGEAGAVLIVIERPKEEGMSPEQVKAWLRERLEKQEGALQK